MLLLKEQRHRLSIDIDIICPPGTEIEEYLQSYKDYGFIDYKPIERIQRGTDIPKSHSKFFYQVAFLDGIDRKETILLDVLNEDCHYNEVVTLPVESRFIKTEGELNYVKVPSIGDILGDKLTAYAPNTTGIPYIKNGKDASMEIIKQGNMKYRIKDDPYACDEFRNAAQQFNEMMDQIEHLKIAIYENELQQDKTRLQYLSQQIQPHFILNSLNTLYNYSEKDVGTTRSIIRLLSRYYRHVVNVNSSYISLREEFAHIDDYLKLQQIRYPGRFSYEIVCPDSTGKLPVPPFLIESFVGNSIKYALGGREKVQLTMRAEEAGPGSTRITVSDTGPGFTDDVLDAVSEYQQSGIVSEELGVGIRNAIDRLRLIYHGRAQITFSNAIPHGARVDILIAFSGDVKELTKEQTDGSYL